MGQPCTNYNKSKLNRFCFLIMFSMTEKSPKEPLYGNIVKITEIKTNGLCFYGFYSDTSARMLFISKLNMSLQSSHKDEAFGTKGITLGQCVNEL